MPERDIDPHLVPPAYGCLIWRTACDQSRYTNITNCLHRFGVGLGCASPRDSFCRASLRASNRLAASSSLWVRAGLIGEYGKPLRASLGSFIIPLGSGFGDPLLQRPILQEIGLNLAQPTRSTKGRFPCQNIFGHIDIEQLSCRYPDKEPIPLDRIHDHLRVPVQHRLSPLRWRINDIARHTTCPANIRTRHRLTEDVGHGPLNRLRNAGR